ncbi:hypothetical protein APHAL10511_002226 [Amanita phalloides]|nr:hypothetical protein APHAL10511_002226 [Amanita phalloides]
MSIQAARKSLGLPPPQPSPAFWAHVLGKEKNTPSQQPLPPLTPLDRNATSTRVLLHDTQANLEKFSAKIDKLLTEFSEAKSEVNLVKTLFERDRESLTNDIIDLVNRCQTQIQKTLGSPAQSFVLDQFSKEVSQRLENLDKRLDAIQTLSQTHAQSLQTQIRAIQAIQEQQCTMLSNLTPLMPLLQAIPLNIDSAKNSILDTLRKQAVSCTKVTQTSPVAKTPCIRRTSKRSRTMSPADNRAALASRTSKRPRAEPNLMLPSSINSITSVARTPRPSSRSDVLFDCSGTPNQNLGTMPTIDQVVNRESTIPGRLAIRQPQLPALGDRTNSLRPDLCSIFPSKESLSRLTSVGRNKSMQITRTPTSTIRSGAQVMSSSINRTENPMLQASVSTIPPPQQIKNSSDPKRSSSHMPAPRLKTAQLPGPQTRQLKPAATLLPSQARLRPLRSRRSPPKEGRRFIPLLDSDDEGSIASP